MAETKGHREIELKNAKKEVASIHLQERFPGDWELLDQSHRHIKTGAFRADFWVPVPAEGTARLTYRVRCKW